MDKIYLHNRNGYNIWLENVNEDIWKLNAKNIDDLAYMRVIYNDDKSIYAIDPSGGPYLQIGLTIGDYYKIKEIYPNGYMLRLSFRRFYFIFKQIIDKIKIYKKRK